MKELSKIASKYLTDKGVTWFNSHGYTEIYDYYFYKLKSLNRKINILEIGVQCGYDLDLFNEYFEGNCEIYGFDINLDNYKCEQKDNIHLFNINASNLNALSNFYLNNMNFSTCRIPMFDIIIDDGSHIGYEQLTSLSFLYNKLSKDGFYIIEDLDITRMNDEEIKNSALWFLNTYKLDNSFNIDLKNVRDSIKYCNIYHQPNNYEIYINGCKDSVCAVLKFK